MLGLKRDLVLHLCHCCQSECNEWPGVHEGRSFVIVKEGKLDTSATWHSHLFIISYTKWDECTRSCASYILTKLSLQHLSHPLRHSIGTHRAAWHHNVGQRQWVEENVIEVQPPFDLMAAKGPRVCRWKEGETEQPHWHRPFQALKNRSTDTWNKQQGRRWTWASLKIPLLSPRQINILSVQHRPPASGETFLFLPKHVSTHPHLRSLHIKIRSVLWTCYCAAHTLTRTCAGLHLSILTAGRYYALHQWLERLFCPPWKASKSGPTDVSKELWHFYY